MYIDKRLQLSSQQALSATAASSDAVDFGADRPVGPGEQLWLVVVAREGLAGTTPTLAVSVETDDNDAFGSAATLASGLSLTDATFPTGTMFVLPFPYTNERYVRAKYTLGGTTPTANVDAFITNQEPANWKSLPDGI